MDILSDSIREEWGNLLALAPRIALALGALVIFLLIGRAVGGVVTRVLQRSGAPASHQGFFRTTIRWSFILLGLVVGLNIVGLKGLATSLVAGGGVTAVVLGFAFRGIGENFLAGFFLVIGRTFKVGDTIRSGDFEGQVRGIELRHTHIRAADGRDIFIPSIQIFSNALVNYTKDGLRRLAFSLGIDYRDDSRRAREVLAATISNCRGVLAEPSSGVRIKDLAPNYVELEVYYWVDTFNPSMGVGEVRNTAMENCRRAVLEAGFTISSEVSTNLNIEDHRAPR